jgi:EmrB/QacA subfamily drug resistance transporter
MQNNNHNRASPSGNGPIAGLHALPGRRKTIIFGTVLGAIFMGTIDVTIVATALPNIVADLGGFQQYAFIATSYLTGTIIMIPIVGKMTDIYGRKWFYIASIFTFVLGSLLSGLSGSMTELIVFRGLQGLGAGGMIANAFTIIGDLYPPSERGKYQSYVSGIFGLSSIIGPLAGGFITDYFGWQWIFYINIPIGFIVILMFLRFLPLIRFERETGKIDYAGIILIILSVVPLITALSWGGNTYSWTSPLITGMLGFSAVAAIVFFFVERRVANPIIPPSLYLNRIISFSVATTFLLGFAMYAAITFVPLWYQGVQGKSATASGSYLTPMMLGLVFGAFLSGQALSRAGGHYRIQGIIGIVILSVGMWLVSTLKVDTPYFTSVAFLVIAGFGLGITFPLYATAIQNVVSRKDMGVAISAVPFWRFMGGALGLAISGSILTSTFTTDFAANIPASIQAAIPPSALSSLTGNLHDFISGQGQDQLKQLLAQYISNPAQAYQQIMVVLREALNNAIIRAMFLGFVVSLTALVTQIFIKEIPLKRRHQD